LARGAEQAGWDGYFIWDHVALWWDRALPVCDPWVTLAAIAAETERIHIGAMVTPVARRRPWKLARETVTLDHLSGGRLVFGIGTGDNPHEFENLDEETDMKVRGDMLDEGMEVLAGLWSGEPFSHDGTHYHVQQAHFLPPPVQRPRIPVWVAGFWPGKRPFRRAARWDGAFPLPRNLNAPPYQLTVQQVKEMMAYINTYRDTDAPFDVLLSNVQFPGDDPEAFKASMAAYAEAGVTWWLEQVNPWRFGWQETGPWPVEAMQEYVLAGPVKLDEPR
jgi:probable F420-dependent oxidoreductase